MFCFPKTTAQPVLEVIILSNFLMNSWGILTCLNQDDQMNTTEFCEHDQKIDNDEP